MEIEKQIGQILNGYQPALVLMTANHLKLFDALTAEAVSAAQVAESLELSLKGTERLLNALAAMDIVLRDGDQYRLNPPWIPFLSKEGDHCMHQWIQLIFDLVPVWMELPRFVQSGDMIKSIMDVLGNDPHQTRAFIDAMHDKALKAPWGIAREIPLGDYRKMLDIGGGPGTYALEWAKVHHHLKATVFDLPNVLRVAEDYIQRYGLTDRVDTRPGDFSQDAFGSGYDLILIANVLHMYDAAASRSLVQKAVDALEPGGRLIVHGFCTDDSETGPLNDVLFSLNIGMLTTGGRAHPVPEKIGWFEDAGLKDIRHFRIEAVPTGVLTGTKD